MLLKAPRLRKRRIYPHLRKLVESVGDDPKDGELYKWSTVRVDDLGTGIYKCEACPHGHHVRRVYMLHHPDLPMHEGSKGHNIFVGVDCAAYLCGDYLDENATNYKRDLRDRLQSLRDQISAAERCQSDLTRAIDSTPNEIEHVEGDICRSQGEIGALPELEDAIDAATAADSHAQDLCTRHRVQQRKLATAIERVKNQIRFHELSAEFDRGISQLDASTTLFQPPNLQGNYPIRFRCSTFSVSGWVCRPKGVDKWTYVFTLSNSDGAPQTPEFWGQRDTDGVKVVNKSREEMVTRLKQYKRTILALESE